MVISMTSSSLLSPFIQELLDFPVDEKGYISDTHRDLVLRRLRCRLDNRQCFDCESRNPTWLSMTYAVFICLTCSGKHRRMGTHISFVRSTDLDKFTRDQLIRMEVGGNGKALTFFKSHGIEKPDFYSKLAVKYKGLLDKECLQAVNIAKSDIPTLEFDIPCSNQRVEVEISCKNPEAFEDVEPQSLQIEHSSTLRSHEISPTIDIKSRHGLCHTGQFPDNCRKISATGVTLEAALTSHVSTTGGVAGVKQVKAKKLDSDFNFDEALEEAACVVQKSNCLSESSRPPLKSAVVKHIPIVASAPCVSHLAACTDATYGLSTATFGRPPHCGQTEASSSSLTAGNSRYANSKSISSADLFEYESGTDNIQTDAHYRHFNGCKSISSDAFLLGDPSLIVNKNTLDMDTSVQLSQLGEQARQGITVLASGAQQTLTKARNWISNFIFEEKPSSEMYR